MRKFTLFFTLGKKKKAKDAKAAENVNASPAGSTSEQPLPKEGEPKPNEEPKL